MSWSLSVPSGPSADFTANAEKAKAAYVETMAGQDYALTQLASGQVEEAIKAAQSVLDSGVVGEGDVTASLSGHHNPGDGSSTVQSVNIALSVTPSAAPTSQAAPGA